ncbi:MAG TPA: hypothetical protein VHJ37_01795 [Thermoleophilaceae bacterium]|nr:hypothetical protein [Thermoleophilaceae bacterium]
MTPTTQTVRELAFLPLECDVPDGQTLRQWRNRRRRAATPSRRRRLLHRVRR